MARAFAKGFYNSKGWSEVRDYILKRDKYLCVKCGAPAEEVHHIIHLSPKNICDPKVTMNPDNLISLCKNCHFDQHKIDKAKVNHNRKKSSFDDSQYEFDADGMLVKKKG